MILESLVLELFKRHVQIEITFSETLTVIRGANYKGKSSLLEGLFFCLFGTSAIIGNKDRITTRGHKGKASAQLVFTHDGRRYYINRTLSTASLNRQLEDESWETVATGHTSVNEAMVDMIGQDRERTLLLSYSRQGETAALATLGESKLNSIVERVSGAVYADQLIERALARVKEAEATLESMPTPDQSLEELQEILEVRTAERDEAQQHYTFAKEREAEVQKLYNASVEERKRIQAHNLQATENENKRKQLELSIASLRGTLSALEQQERTAEQPKDMDDTSKQIAALVQREEQIGLDNQARQTQIARRQGAVEWVCEYEAKYLLAEETAQPEVVRLEAELKAATTEQSAITAEMGKVAGDINRLKASIKSSECPTCHRPYEDDETGKDQHIRHAGQLEEAEQLYVEISAKGAAQATKVDSLNTQLKAKQRTLPPADWRTTLKTKQEVVAACNAKLEQIAEHPASELSEVQAELADLRAAVKRNLAVNRAWTELKENLVSAEKNLLHKTRDLEAIEIIEKIDIGPVSQLADKQAEELSEIKQLAGQKSNHVMVFTHTIEEVGKKIEREKARLERRRAAEHRKARFGGLAKWLRDNKTAFLAETWDQMMALVSEFAAQVTDGAIEKVLRTDDGSFMYEENGFEQPLNLASGCQKSVIGAGMRIALDAVLSAGLGFLVLDEPSSDMDEQHAAALAGALRAQSRQVILVTHREGEEFTSDQLHILE